ncbi:MAG TPA: alkaline phosphatase family protein, partial [Tepidisphaeraceae bacterium]|nr:alkaline phosphatase family protein [Tepidisphaeraceae bacterium]
MAKTLLIGWDAADWRFINPLIDRGLMPTLASLRGRSAFGNLSTLQPALSPMLWTSIATGHRASQHGILGFVEPMPDGQGVRPSSSTSRRRPALWNMADAAGLTSHVVGWYATHPAEPTRGCVVSNQFEIPTSPHGQSWPVPPGSVAPASLAAEFASLRIHPREITPEALLPFVPPLANATHVADPLLGKLRCLIAQTASIHAVATHLIEHTPWDLCCVYYEGIDRFGHEFMQFHPPRMPGTTDEQFERYQHVMTGCYRWFDMILDRLIELAGADTNIVLISDHGYFHDTRRPRVEADPQSWHRSHGIAVVAGPGVRAGERLFGGTLLDVAPTVLALLGLPAGDDMPGRAWTEALTASPPARIASWNDRVAPSDSPPGATDPSQDPAALLASLQQLAELGYVDSEAISGPRAAAKAAELRQYNLAISLLDEQRPAEAAEILRALHEQHPGDPGLTCQLALALAASGDHVAASAAAEPLRHHTPIHPRAHLLLGSLALSAGDATQAETHFDAVARAEVVHPDLHCRLGQVYLTARRFDDATRAFAECVRLDPDHAVGLDGAAEAAIGRHDYHAARQFALAAIASVQHLPRAHYHLAVALRATGNDPDALTAAAVCVRLAPA